MTSTSASADRDGPILARWHRRDADVRIGGHGDVDIAPTDVAKISIGGSGDVTLHSNPKDLETHIGGSGQIHHAAS